MTAAHLGPSFDLHGGGKDLIFPHHENEIAQSQAADGPHSFARYWLHNGLLTSKGVKFGKSLGNAIDCSNVTNAVGGEALRLYFVSHHFRSTIDFDFKVVRDADDRVVSVRFHSLEAADRKLEYFYTTLKRIDDLVGPAAGPAAEAASAAGALSGAVVPEAEKLVPDARAALADDFNTPVVMAQLHEACALANRLLDEGKGIDKQLRRRSLARIARDLRVVGGVLGVFGKEPRAYLAERRGRLVARRGIDVAAVECLLADRVAARAAKDFARGDAIRAELAALGVALHDAPHGTEWTVQDDSC
jgi:cysteinyl-tRNA synthetase